MQMAFLRRNADYETWLRTQCDVVDADLDKKHKRMAESPFAMLRATYFRYAAKVEKLLPDLADAPHVLAVGDIHVENFGTWRDAEGRLIWGVNDFDEAAVMPYPFDLVRLCASAGLSPDLGDHEHAADAILAGYERGLAEPAPMVLDADASWLRPFVSPTEKTRADFAKEMETLPDFDPPGDVKAGFAESFPEGAVIEGYAPRAKGGGSLGRPRYIAVATWRGGRIVREAKALVPSAWDYAHKKEGWPPRFRELADGPFRAPDPFLDIRGRYLFRRIAPDSRKLDFGGEIPKRLQELFLEAMGHDIGAIHAASGQAEDIAAHLKTRPEGWLRDGAMSLSARVLKDFKAWQAAYKPETAPPKAGKTKK
jgi:hypothetical protein